MPLPLQPLLNALVSAATFEDAAVAVLADLQLRATELLPPDAQVLGALIHLKPDNVYRACVRLEVGDSAPWTPGREPGPSDALPSLTAWRWMSQNGGAISVDLASGVVTPGTDHGPLPPRVGESTLAGARQRRATHLWVLPLLGVDNRTEGMFTLDLHAPSRRGRALPLPQGWEEHLGVPTRWAGPYLLARPPRAEESDVPLGLPAAGRAMQPVLRMLDLFARSETPILLRGESGTGKTRLAEWCHSRSGRRGPFVVADLHGLVGEALQARLFGTRKGAFTGVGATEGLLAAAEGGTLFLDEIDKVDLKGQAALLTLLERRTYKPMGDTRDRPANVRFLLATNGPIEDLCQTGAFRHDLFWRIQDCCVELPPLSRRRDEIPAWVSLFLEELGRDLGLGLPTLAPEAMDLLQAAPWTGGGNLRELRSVLRKALALACPGPTPPMIREEHVRPHLASGPTAAGPVAQALQTGARLFWEEACKRRERGEPPLDLDLAQGLGGLVVEAALESGASRREVALTLGLTAEVRADNHHRRLNGEREKALLLRQALGLRRT